MASKIHVFDEQTESRKNNYAATKSSDFLRRADVRCNDVNCKMFRLMQ